MSTQETSLLIQLRSRAEIHTQTERVWTSSLKRRNAVSQKLGRDTHLERSAGVLDEEECSGLVLGCADTVYSPPGLDTEIADDLKAHIHSR